ncbi:MAG: sensor histidine kinase [Myxococcales bacterium]|nr:sensor histidine kinase [Myxococcales bacterium]
MSARTPTPLAPALARRVAPLALLAGLVVGVVLPMLYRAQVLGERTREAAVQAGLVADRVARLAQRRPLLWAYDHPELRSLTESAVAPPLLGRVRIDTAETTAAFTAGRAARPDDLVGWAPIQVGGRAVARVELRLPAERTYEGIATLWAAAAALGLLLSAGLFFAPLAVIRRGDRTNAGLYAELQGANAHLEDRVAARTAELKAGQQRLQELGARLVQVQEEERARISRDLHDDLGQVLTGLRLQLTAARGAVGTGPAGPLLDAAIAAVDDGVEQVRTLAHNLRPAALDGLGVRAAIHGHATQWAAQAGLTLSLALDPGPEPPGPVGAVLFRVAQEALTNVARHARASAVTLCLREADDGWLLTVDDDGVGLPTDRAGGLGLVGAEERVTQAGGYLDLGTSPAGGARLLAWLPPEA